MHRYIPNTESDVKEMLSDIGAKSINDLFVDIPEKIRFSGELNLEPSKSELEVTNILKKLGDENKSLDELVCFLGAGAYDHFVPTTVKHMASRSEFFTAYTPYQPEISQGTLRAIFEYQSLICELTGMDNTNASMYDGQTAVVEAAMMAVASSRKANKILVSKGLNPEARQVLNTYIQFRDIELEEISLVNGATNLDELKEKLSADVAGVIVQSPNFLGVIEDVKKASELVHETKAVLIDYVDPISLGILESPGNLGVDIVCGEAQSLGNGMNFGGPYIGFLASKSKYVRKLPGRVVGQSTDVDGKRAFVLTLQAREQHIRRYKATSNICSNQGLNALMSSIYMVTMGKEGLKEVAYQSMAKAHYAYDKLIASGKYKPAFEGQSFFKEFALIGQEKTSEVNERLLKNNVLGGYDLEKSYDIENGVLLAVTEKRTKDEIDNLVKLMEVK
ncbi:aminomethyl-transferring glycine dehydrogenase subunit GcvPA [Helicovermis profundi]|uniref:Probable glycine dehydrogenase (decarboxylating) subunit 1 n=1 Tax=Helicovermis profundi TaxID=3065157 RepID=A0AAU9E0M7_9FIRM|nr:hypothetical protein HLPR_04270 [Clostridia bacterium S502]